MFLCVLIKERTLQEYEGFESDIIDAGVKIVTNFASSLFKGDDS